MILDFNTIEESVLPQFKGGEKAFHAKMATDSYNKIILGRLEPGASIGRHTHESNSEIIYVLQGKGMMWTEDGEETLTAGLCHYCPKGQAHSFRNESQEDLIFFAVVPEHECMA